MNTENKTDAHRNEDKSWMERNVNIIILGLIIACVGTIIVQLVFPMFDEHHPPHFPEYENVIGFQAIFGFAAFVIVVFLGKGLRLIIKRDEDYYDA